MNLKLKIDNTYFNEDLLNFGELQLEYNRQEKTIRIPSLKLKGAALQKILNIISQKRTLEKVPVAIYIDNEEVFSGYLDFTQDHNLACEDFFVGVHADRIDILRDLAQGFTVDMLSPKVEKVLTVTSRVPQYTEAALALAITFIIGIELRNQIQKLLEEVSGLAGNPLEWGRIVVLILRVAYISFFVASIIIMLKRFYELIIGDAHEFGAYSVEDTLKKGASKLGLNFFSDVTFLKDLYIMPPQSPDAKQNYEILTYGDFLQRVSELLSCVTFVKNNTLYMVRDVLPSNCFAKIDKVTEPKEIKLNASEILVREELKLPFDDSDANTLLLKNYYIQLIREGLKAQSEKVIYAPYALGRRKDKLTLPEEILKDALVVIESVLNAIITVVNGIISVVNAIIKVINGIIKVLRSLGIKIRASLKSIPPIQKQNFSAKIEERKGALLLENGVVGTPRILTLSGNKLADKQYGVEEFYKEWYTNDRQKEKRLYTAFAPVCYSKVKEILSCGMIEIEGKKYLLEALEYNYSEQVGKITYSEPYNFAKFVKRVKLV